jgi:hypothetical protein
MWCGEPVAAEEAISTLRDRREATTVGVRQVNTRIAQVNAIHGDSGAGDLDYVSWKSGEDLEDRRGVPGAGAGREIGAGTAKPSSVQGETGGDEAAAGQRQRHGTIEPAGER